MQGDEPIYEGELVGRDITLRATVDVTDDGEPFSMLAAEPNEGLLRQQVMMMEPDDWLQLAVICVEVAKCWDGINRVRFRQAEAVAS